MAETAEKTGNEADGAAEDIRGKLAKSERDAAISRAALAEAQRRSTSSAAEAERFRTQAESATTIAITSTITGLEQERDKLKADLSQAMADGEFTKVADIQFQMSEVASKLTNATAQKAHLDATRPKGDGKDPTLTDREKPFDKEAYLAARSPESAAWLREHDQYFTDAAFQNRVAGAHNLAIGKGLKVDTPDYFEFIEKHALDDLGSGDDPYIPPGKKKEETKGKVPFAAPPSRDGGTAAPKLRPGDRYIPADMRDYAERVCNVKPEEYYDQYVGMVQEGKIEDRFGVFKR